MYGPFDPFDVNLKKFLFINMICTDTKSEYTVVLLHLYNYILRTNFQIIMELYK